MTSASARLRERLERGDLLVLPGAANALTARVIEDAGFDAVYLSGAGIANTFLGVPDIGLVSLSQLVEHVAAVRAAVEIPLIVDIDTGFGNAVNVVHTVSLVEAAGADAVQIEDQVFPKRCGHFAGKEVIPAREMVEKIRAAVATRREALIIARTDALAVHGLEEACERANAYRLAGADIIFVEAPRNEAEVAAVGRIEGRKLLNLVEGGLTPALPRSRIQALGFSIALYANLPLLAAVKGMQEALGALSRDEPAAALGTRLATWEERQRLVRKPWFDALEAKYASASPPGP
ncbi:MAG: oxaloacetate decarboxylase [Dehalococcoidia bacterium]